MLGFFTKYKWRLNVRLFYKVQIKTKNLGNRTFLVQFLVQFHNNLTIEPSSLILNILIFFLTNFFRVLLSHFLF